MIMTRYSVNNNTPMGLVISLCSNSNHLISNTPKTASNFRHLLSCGTIVCDTIVHRDEVSAFQSVHKQLSSVCNLGKHEWLSNKKVTFQLIYSLIFETGRTVILL